MMRGAVVIFCVLMGLSSSQCVGAVEFADYQQPEQLSGTIRTHGSSTVTNMLGHVMPLYNEVQPEVRIQFFSGGSGRAIPALLAGEADVGLLSRPLKDEEIIAWQQAYGVDPTVIIVGFDALAVVVHKDNPMPHINAKQSIRIFAQPDDSFQPATTWGDLGFSGEWQERPITPVGMESYRGAYALFRKNALRGKAFRLEVSEEPVTSSIAQAVAVDRGAIGYVSTYYKTPMTRFVPLLGDDGRIFDPTPENIASGLYPSRKLVMVLPHGTIKEELKDFIRFVTSRQGNRGAVASGFVPLSPSLAQQQRVVAESHDE